MKLAAFILCLSAYSWGFAYVVHVVTWADTEDLIGYDGHTHYTRDTPRWYFFPLLGNMLGGYAAIVAIGCKTKAITL